MHNTTLPMIPRLVLIALLILSGTKTASAACTIFTKDLEPGMNDPEVKTLQVYLNSSGFQVAQADEGSPGKETTHYGPNTQRAVAAFQTRNTIPPTGILGPVTRARIQTLSCSTSGSTGSTIEALLARIAELTAQLQALSDNTDDNDKSADENNTPALTIISPKEGDTWSNAGGCASEDTCTSPRSIGTIFWTYSDPNAKVSIDLIDDDGDARRLVTKTENSGRYVWEYDRLLPAGEYSLTLTVYGADDTVRATKETGTFTISKDRVSLNDDETDPRDDDDDGVTCPPVPSKVRTYTQDDLGDFFKANLTSQSPSRVVLKHYRYPETVTIENSISFVERCALTAIPGSRTCPYTQGIYGTEEQYNTYSIMTRDPDPLNDPNEVGDRQAYAYLKPIVGIKAANRAFDMSIPFIISEDHMGMTYDFTYYQNWDGPDPGQWSISECEGDYSEQAIITGFGPKYVRFFFLATDDLEGSRTRVYGGKQLALKVGKTYYFNTRQIEEIRVPGNAAHTCLWNPDKEECYSPMVHTDELSDDAILDDTLFRLFRPLYLEFYRWIVLGGFSSSNPDFTMSESIFKNDPFFRKPGEAFIDYTLYNPACGEGTNAVFYRSLIKGVNDQPGTVLNLDTALLDSQCKPVCGAPGYVAEGNKCVKQ